MSSVVSSVLGANSAENVAGTQASASKYATDVSAKTAAAQLAEQQAEYKQSTDAASKQLAEASSAIQSATASTPAELLQEKADIESGNTKALQDLSKQTSANLATSGVRGGQAATLKNRAVGEATTEAQKNIDELLAEDAASRRSALTGYYTSVGGTSAGNT